MSWPRTAVVVLVALVLQVTLLSRFSYEGARADIMVLLAVVAGYRLGPERGAIVGFASGLSFDIVLSTPLGLSALIYTVVGYGVGAATSGMVRTSRWASPLVAAVGSAVAMVLYALVGAVLGEPTLSGPSLASIVVLVAVVNAALAPLATRAIDWIKVDDRDRRQTLFAR
ncbi:MAG: rod shape-determining protein MreD [Ilumatobacteraceae bacterium]|nr:rod shape-determining protein MreD [Ilumatobacteraceae bacterium]